MTLGHEEHETILASLLYVYVCSGILVRLQYFSWQIRHTIQLYQRVVLYFAAHCQRQVGPRTLVRLWHIQPVYQ